MKLPRALGRLVEAFERLPGIGPKTSARLAYYLLQSPPELAVSFAEALNRLHPEIKVCQICRNVAEADPCETCLDPQRDKGVVCVVEKPLDLLAIDRSGSFHGRYHVLGGALSPLNNVGPEELYIKELISRLASPESGEVREVILAMNANLEGEATAMYLAKLICQNLPAIKVTRIGRGLPVGSDLEYADDVTLTRAMEGRQVYQ